ncbi:unnamed protein product [Caenorhabditis nigoni]
MKKLIKSTQMNRFKSIESIWYYCDSTDRTWVFMNKSSVCSSYRDSGFSRFMRIVEHNETKNDYFQSNVSGKIIDFRLEYEYCVAFYRKSEKESVIKSIHNHFLDFFGDSIDYNWRAGDVTDYSRKRMDQNPFIPLLRNVSFYVNTSLEWDFANMEQVETFFSASPIFKSIRMNAIGMTEPLNPESKFYQAESIQIHQDTITFPAVLRHFQGRQAIINCKEYKTSDLIEFLIRWKSGEAFQKLEYLKIEMGRTPRIIQKMILSKYPYVIQKEILDNMNYSQLFLLSFVSKNMKKLIKSLQMNRFKSIKSIEYECDRTDQPWVHVYYGNVRERIMRIAEREGDKNDYFQSNVSGKIIDFRFSKPTFFVVHPIASYHPSEKESVIQAIHNYFLDFFGNSVEYNWQAMDFKIRQGVFIPFIPQLPNVPFCVYMRLFPDNLRTREFLHMDQVENFFSSSPVLKSVKMSVLLRNQSFNPDSKFYQTESIEIIQDKIIKPAILRHFPGRQAVIKCSSHKTSHLIEFVNRWKSGEAFKKLEYLKVEMNRTPRNRFLDAIGLKHIDETKQPPTLTFPKVYDWHDEHAEPYTEPITSHIFPGDVRSSDFPKFSGFFLLAT